jgi:hypothetical protein
MPGIGLLMDGAMQQAPHPLRQASTVVPYPRKAA